LAPTITLANRFFGNGLKLSTLKLASDLPTTMTSSKHVLTLHWCHIYLKKTFISYFLGQSEIKHLVKYNELHKTLPVLCLFVNIYVVIYYLGQKIQIFCKMQTWIHEFVVANIVVTGFDCMHVIAKLETSSEFNPQRYINKNRVRYRYLDNEVSCQQLFWHIRPAI